MPLQNRVTPYGEIISSDARGLFMGNRGGRIHDPTTQTLTNRRWASKQWICCITWFKNRQRAVMGRSYTELFFLDEITAFSAGHRPCYECRRNDALAFAGFWASAHNMDAPPKAGEMDTYLHGRRRISGNASSKSVDIDQFPDGTMVEIDGVAMAVREKSLLPWRDAGYLAPRPLTQFSSGRLLTPVPIVNVLRAGYRPHWHPSADQS